MHCSPGDLLAVTVYEEAELSREVLVRPDGGISFPLVGDIAVANMSPAEGERQNSKLNSQNTFPVQA